MSKDITLTREEAEELLRWAKEVQKWSDAIHDDHPNCYGLVKMMQSKLSAAEDENKKYFRRCDGCVGKGYYGSDFDKCTECDGAGKFEIDKVTHDLIQDPHNRNYCPSCSGTGKVKP